MLRTISMKNKYATNNSELRFMMKLMHFENQKGYAKTDDAIRATCDSSIMSPYKQHRSNRISHCATCRNWKCEAFNLNENCRTTKKTKNKNMLSASKKNIRLGKFDVDKKNITVLEMKHFQIFSFAEAPFFQYLTL